MRPWALAPWSEVEHGPRRSMRLIPRPGWELEEGPQRAAIARDRRSRGEARGMAGAVRTRSGSTPEPRVDYAPEGRSDHLPPMRYRDMPEPLPLRKVLGPSVILAGVGVGSGEYILWPYISANAGIGFLYLAVVGVTIQYFLNMEIERYTLATGETAIAGFAR